MPDPTNSQKFIKNLTGFIETKIELIKLDLREEFSDVMGKIIGIILMIFTFFLIIIFASLTLASYFNELLGSSVWGFGIVTLIYIVIILLVYLLRDKGFLKRIVSDKIKKHLK